MDRIPAKRSALINHKQTQITMIPYPLQITTTYNAPLFNQTIPFEFPPGTEEVPKLSTFPAHYLSLSLKAAIDGIPKLYDCCWDSFSVKINRWSTSRQSGGLTLSTNFTADLLFTASFQVSWDWFPAAKLKSIIKGVLSTSCRPPFHIYPRSFKRPDTQAIWKLRPFRVLRR